MLDQSSILLVEDNDSDAHLALTAFRRAKISSPLVRARDGAEALDYLFGCGDYAARNTHNLPLFVLLDLNIPKISGLAVLAKIRADLRTKRLPVIILTSSSEETDREAAYDRYTNSYVVKPLDFDKFVAAMSQINSYWTELNEPPPIYSD